MYDREVAKARLAADVRGVWIILFVLLVGFAALAWF
jgi:hypothetical protein